MRSSRTEPRYHGSVELARCNGTVIVQDADRVGIVERGGGWIGTAIFVAALVGGIGVLGGVTVATLHGVLAGASVIAVGAGGLAATVALVRAQRTSRAAPLPRPWLVFDRAARVVRSGDGRELCRFDAVRIARAFQVGSSSQALAVHCPNKIIVARGTPFGDDVSAVEQVLRRAIA